VVEALCVEATNKNSEGPITIQGLDDIIHNKPLPDIQLQALKSKRADEDSEGPIAIQEIVRKPGRPLPVIQLEALKSKYNLSFSTRQATDPIRFKLA
jgi:hypothetical protein